jgi:LysR family transcriptional regulator, hydrogen peroxide-inducible genes activator
MNLQQLEYIVAVDTHRHFATAAGKCFVTQPTLSMMIQKLEHELGVQIFDRSKQPVMTTDAGREIILQARRILDEIGRIQEIAHNYKGEVKGELRIGIIPTLSPYLLPLFLNNFLQKYPQVKVKIMELTTRQIVDKLTTQLLDAGILATPLNLTAIAEDPIFYEEFVVYTSAQESSIKKKYLLAEDIDVDRLWLLEEGHCLRSQVINLCELKKRETEAHNLDYEAGSIETLKKIVDISKGITILPELAVKELSKSQLSQIHYFKPPAPVREISLVTYHHFIKTRLIEALREEILKTIPEKMKYAKKRQVAEIEL